MEEGGPEHLTDPVVQALACGGEVSRPSKLRDPTTDPGAPSYRQPLPNFSPKKPRIFSQWITTEHPYRRRNGGCADSSGNLPCPREHSQEAQHHHPSETEQGVGLALLVAVAKLSHTGHSDTLQNGKLEAMHYSAEPLQGRTEPHPRRPLL